MRCEAGRIPIHRIVRAVHRRLGDADQQPHQWNALLRSDGEILEFVTALEGIAQAHGRGPSVPPDNGNPCVSRKIHRIPPAGCAPTPQRLMIKP